MFVPQIPQKWLAQPPHIHGIFMATFFLNWVIFRQCRRHSSLKMDDTPKVDSFAMAVEFAE